MRLFITWNLEMNYRVRPGAWGLGAWAWGLGPGAWAWGLGLGPGAWGLGLGPGPGAKP